MPLLARCFCLYGLLVVSPAWSQSPTIRFDLPPIAVAAPAADATETAQPPQDVNQVAIELPLSSLIDSPELPKIDHWIVQVLPRDRQLALVDYAPRTEVASDVAGTIQVKQSKEKNRSSGISLDGSYGHLARLHAGSDHATKDIDSYQLDRVAPVQAVTASGTIQRGRGVFFKLRWTAQQVLEGEKTFRLVFRVPQTWRASLLDVSVVAQAEHKTFAGLDSETKTIGAAHFIVATHRQGDHDAARQAEALFDAEHSLRQIFHQYSSTETTSLSDWLRRLTSKGDRASKAFASAWLERLLLHDADPYWDEEISKLPMPVRVAVLDYVEVREEFLMLNPTFQHR